MTLDAKNIHDHLKWTKSNQIRNIVLKNYKDKCYCCDMKGHLSRVCPITKYPDLFQTSIEKKSKDVEENFTSQILSHEGNDVDGDLENEILK